MRTAVMIPLSQPQLARLSVAGLDVVEIPGDGPCPPAFRAARLAFGNPPADWLAEAIDLEWVQLESVGFSEYLGQDLGGVVVTNLAGFFAEPVAESVLAGILSLYRGIPRATLLRAAGVWASHDIRAGLRCLTRARVTLFGMGSINTRLAGLFEAFGCTITPFRSDWRPDALEESLRRSDVVVACAPDAPGSRGVFDARRLAMMPSDAILASFGRGSVLDEAALVDALVQGRLGGAVIDVTRDEPLPVGHPFWTCPNLVLTQHSGGGTTDEVERKIDRFLSNLERFRRGEPLPDAIDQKRGY